MYLKLAAKKKLEIFLATEKFLVSVAQVQLKYKKS